MAQREEETELKVPDNVALCAKSCGRPGHDKPRSSPTRAQDSQAAAAVDARGGEGPSGAAVTEDAAPLASAPARAVSRCSGCRRKVGLTGFRCRCGDLFCAEHRYSDRHDCGYDYKAAGREAIRRDNPAVRAAKIVRI